MIRPIQSRRRRWHIASAFTAALVAGLGAAAASAQSTKPADAAGGRFVDAHQKVGEFKPQRTRTLEDLAGLKSSAMPDRTEFGGVKRYPASKATGFFRTEKIDGRWWLIDPTGHRMILAGVASTNIPKMSPDAQAAFDRTFASPAEWAARTRELIRENGFDGTGSWSDDARLREGAKQPLVHTRILSFMGKYAEQRGGTHEEAGHKGYPNKCAFFFDPEFAAFAETFAKGAAAFKDDPYLLGYFTDNELPFPLDALDRYLTLPENDPGRKAADAFVAERKLKADALTDGDRQAFMALAAERYFSIVSGALRKYDPNHLILGPRFHSTDHRNAALLATASKHIDVVGYNLYNVWTPGSDLMGRLSVGGTTPVLISEFYAKADDVGLGNVDGAGWWVRTQRDRGAFYQNFTLGLLESKAAVGWHWFKYIDGDPAMPSGVNLNDSNKGIVSNRFVPYPALLDSMRQLNASRYEVIDYFDRAAKAARP